MRKFIAQAVQVVAAVQKAGPCSDHRYSRTQPAFRCALLVLLALALLGRIGQAQEPLVIDPNGGVTINKTLAARTAGIGENGNPDYPLTIRGRYIYSNLILFKDDKGGASYVIKLGNSSNGVDNESPGFTLASPLSPVNSPMLFIQAKTDNVGIGTNSVPSKLSVGGTGYFSGNVGIGTTPSGQKLSVSGAETTGDGFGAAIGILNTAKGGANWYLRAGAEGTRTPAGGFSIANDGAYMLVVGKAGNVGIGAPNPDQYGAKLAVDGSVLISGTINGEKPALKFTIKATGSGPWNAAVIDIKDLCGDDDGCRIKLLIQNNNGQVRTITEEIYIADPDGPKRNGGLGGYTRQSGGGEREWELDTGGTTRLFPEDNGPWGWCQAFNYVPSGYKLLTISPTKLALNTATPPPFGSAYYEPNKAFRGNDKYNITFTCDPNVTGTFIIYDR